MLDLKRAHRVRWRAPAKQRNRAVDAHGVLVCMRSPKRHQPLEYYTSRPTPFPRATDRPLELEIRYCVGAVRTAPTQLATWRSVAARRGDRVTDGDIVLLAADEDFAHDEAQDALLLVHGQLVEAVGEAGEEAFERLGELEVGLGVVQFGFEGGELRGERGLALAQLGHPLAQLLERDQLLQ